ncbi:hypothetical protein ABMA27_012765 [Loxostege sticticalis]|uniref:Peptidase S1 domain-containing protein n=1 Tax=Loxostege sticticalis TaxID=481309 RepID=A0ABR3GZQ2_LOXSC
MLTTTLIFSGGHGHLKIKKKRVYRGGTACGCLCQEQPLLQHNTHNRGGLLLKQPHAQCVVYMNFKIRTSSCRRECGVQKRQTVPDFVKTRVNEADPGEFPWAVSLMIKKYQFGSYPMFSYTGTGSLIHDRVVLTAAHVLENKNLENLYATVGEHDVFNKILPKKAIKVTEVVVHNKFVSSNGNYNFALAFLRSSATANLPHVGTVCLPPAGFVASAGASCAFSGWGTDSAQKQIVQLTKTEVPMMTHSACEQKLKQLFGPRFKLHASFTCAGGEVGRDICTGGGGSPLVCPIEGQGRYVQTGIVSWVPDGCGVDGASIVFADVAAARPWIDQQMAEHLYSTASYTY